MVLNRCPSLPTSFAVPETQILGESSLHVEKASSLNLTCLLRTKGNDGDGDVASPPPPLSSPSSSSSPAASASKSRLRWYKDGKVRTVCVEQLDMYVLAKFQKISSPA